MNRLKIILQSRKIIFILFVLTILITIIKNIYSPQAIYQERIYQLTGTIISKEVTNEKITLIIKTQEILKGNYYFKKNCEKDWYEKNFHLGDQIFFKGDLIKPETKTTKNQFDYYQYLKNRNIYHLVRIESMKLVQKNKNLFYIFKDYMQNKIKNPYMRALILGDKSKIKEEVLESYQVNGISHLFAISGMHINLLSQIILRVLKMGKIKKKTQYKILSLFLFCYLLLVGITPSIIRGILFFLLFSINKSYQLNIKKENIIMLTISITILINPNFLQEVAFWYSFIISIGLLYLKKRETTYLKNLFVTSLFAFVLSTPISLYYFYQINLLSILYNLFYIPFMSIIFFPITLITLIFPFLTPIYKILIFILENTSLFFSNIKLFILIFPKQPLLVYGIYILLIFYSLKNKKVTILLLFLLVIHYLSPIVKQDFIKIIDVGQGDCILLYSKNKTVLIDTGGKYEEKKFSNTITKYKTIPLLKSLGIKKLNYVLLTHGDLDHMGEIFYLNKNFKIGKIYINLGAINKIEKKLLKEQSKVTIIKEKQVLKVGNYQLVQLNKAFLDENSSSSVYYLYHPNLKGLFMADATIKTENYLLSKYNLKVDILKIGHHGSITSTSDNFLKKTCPKLAIISVGENNHFNHPSPYVLKKLTKYNIPYLTTISSGTITIFPKTNEIVEDKKE